MDKKPDPRPRRGKPTLSGTLLRNTCGAAALAIALLGGFWIMREYGRFTRAAEESRKTEMEKRKLALQTTVDRLVADMEALRPAMEKRSREEMKARVDEAVAFSQHLFDYFKKTRDLKDIGEIVRESLRPIRFDGGQGYFFAADMKGVQQLFTIHPELEGKNLLQEGKTHEAEVLQKLIDGVRDGEGFVHYSWHKPGVEGQHEKISFVKRFAPLDWLLGTGYYVENLQESVRERAIEMAEQTTVPREGYVFVGRMDGFTLVGPGKGQNNWDTEDDGEKIVQELVRQAQEGGGFVTCHEPPTGGTSSKCKLNYVRPLPQWGWYVGAAAHVADVQNTYAQSLSELRKRLIADISSILLVLIALMVLAYLLATRTSHRLQSSFLAFTNFFGRAADQRVGIDDRSIRFAELSNLARYANRMVEDMHREHDALADSESMLSQAEDLASLGTFRFYPDTQQLVWSEQMYHIHGLDPAMEPPTLEQQESLILEQDREYMRTKTDESRESGKPVEFECRIHRPDGAIRTLSAVVAWRTSRDTPRGFVAGAVQDVTRRKRIELERGRLAVAIEQAAEDIMLTGPAGVIEYVNPAFEKITGYPRQEAIGKKPSILKSGKHTEAFYKGLWDSLTAGHVWRGRITNRRRDGELVEEEATISPIFGPEGEITGYVSVKRDVTQERHLEGQLRQSQKMEAIGTLAGGIAHDFNNILSGIMGYTEMALLDLPKDSELRGLLTQVMGAGERAASLVRQILTFSRQGEQEKRPMQFQSVLKEALKLLRGSLPSSIRIIENIEPDCPPVVADPTQLHQVVMNLCTNAYHAMQDHSPTDGREMVLEIGMSTVKIEEEHLTQIAQLTPGEYVRLTVADNGHGMDAATRDRIFDPYFTTKEKGHGTGLGLATVLSIVQEHGGGVTVYSEVGQGTVFHVYLPVCEGMGTRPGSRPDETLETVRGTERVLFVDDEPTLVDLSRNTLERYGYQVSSFTDPVKAMEAFSADPAAFDVVITDFTMPRMTGLEVARMVREKRPTVPVLMCTGFSEQLTEEHARRVGVRAVVMKPIVGIKLAAALRTVLDTNGG